MRKNIIFLLIVCIFSSISTCWASEIVRDDKMLSYMSNHPSEFYYLMSPGSGMSNYIDAKSLNVETYSPPIYIISFKEIFVSRSPNGDVRAHVGYSRYKYDYNTRTVYRGNEENGTYIWEEVTYFKTISAADLVFAMAYNMHFFDKYDKGDLTDMYLQGKVIVYEE